MLVAAIPDLGALALDSPLALRGVVAVVGLVLLLVGARVYEWALGLAAFGLGAVGAATAVSMASVWIPVLRDGWWPAGAGVIGGLAVLFAARMAHKVALLAVGAVVGLVAAAAAVSWLPGVPVWVPLPGAVVGALVFPFAFPTFLKVLTPAAGAVCLAWATGHPDSPIWVGGLWAVGALVQLFVGGRGDRDDDEG